MELFEIGRILKPQGLKGSMKVMSYLENIDILRTVKEVSVRRGGEAPLPFRIKKIRAQGKFFFLDLESIDDIDAARSLTGSTVLIPQNSLEALSDDEYYWHELVGFEVVTEEGKALGRISDILATGSNDVYVCTGGEREILLPAIADVIKKIDRHTRVMVVRLLEGL